METRKVYICSPCSKEEQIENREGRVMELSERLSKKGFMPMWCDAGDDIGERMNTLVQCDGILLDNGWKKCQICRDEAAVASSRRLAFFHTKEEWGNIKKSFVI